MTDDLTTKFADWVQTMPAGEEYCYSSTGGCALFRFLGEAGYPVAGVGGSTWRDTSNIRHPIPCVLSDALVKSDWELPNDGRTFGALAERLAPYTTMAKAIKACRPTMPADPLPRVTTPVDMEAVERIERWAAREPDLGLDVWKGTEL